MRHRPTHQHSTSLLHAQGYDQVENERQIPETKKTLNSCNLFFTQGHKSETSGRGLIEVRQIRNT